MDSVEEMEDIKSGGAPWDIPMEFISSVQSRFDGVRQQIDRTRQQFDRTVPELRKLVESPGLSNMMNEIGRGLVTRLGARALKVLLRQERKDQEEP